MLIREASPDLYRPAKSRAGVTAPEPEPPSIVDDVTRLNLGVSTRLASHFNVLVDLAGCTSCRIEIWGLKEVNDPAIPGDTIKKWAYAENSIYDISRTAWTESFDCEMFERMYLRVVSVTVGGGSGVAVHTWAG